MTTEETRRSFAQSLRCLFLWLGLLLCGLSSAQDATIEVTAFPAAIVADGISSTTLTLTIRNRNGSLVPDGTQILLETTLGQLSQNSVTTTNGLARVTLTSGLTKGNATITISVLSFRSSRTFAVTFAGSQDEISSDNESYVITSDRRITYSPELRIFEASGPGQKASIQFRNLSVKGDDLQFDLRSFVLKGRKVTVEGDGESVYFHELSLNLQTLEGVGLKDMVVSRLSYLGAPPYFEIVPTEDTRPNLVNIQGLKSISVRREPALPDTFAFVPLDVPTLIYARKAIAQPTREVRFNDATVDVNGTVILKVPLFRTSTQSSNPNIAEDFIQVGNNQLAINYPYYLSLGGHDESLLRLRYGTLFQRGAGGAGGLFLDFERSWRANDDNQGGVALVGALRKDWGLTGRQSLRLDSKSRSFLQVDFPAHNLLVGSAFVDRDLGGLRANLNLNGTQSTRGPKNSTRDITFSLATVPKPVAKLPFSVSVAGVYGNRNSTFDLSPTSRQRSFQEFFGSSLNLSMRPINGPSYSINSTARVTKQWGRRVSTDPVLTYDLNSSARLSSTTSATMGYTYSSDPFERQFIGQHRLNSSLSMRSGRVSTSAFGTTSLDVSRYNLQADATYRISQLWRIGFYTTLDGFRNSEFQETSYSLSYRLGARDIGISYDQRRRRLGFELLRASFD